MWITALFITVSTWKQISSPLIGEYINKLRNTKAALLLNTYREVATKPSKGRGGLERKLLSERKLSVKGTPCLVLDIGHSGKGRSIETGIRFVAARG